MKNTERTPFRKRTRWKRCKSKAFIGKRFFDGGEYGLGYFTILKLFRCKEYTPGATALDGTHWFTETLAVIKTDSGITYRVPFIPWAKMVVAADSGEAINHIYDRHPF